MYRDKEIQIAQIKGKTAIVSAAIGSIGVIIAAIIGVFSFNINIENNRLKQSNKILESEKAELITQTDQSEEEYENLKNTYSDLEKENDNLQDRLSALESELTQYDLLVEENSSLETEISELKRELKSLKKNETKESTEDNNEEDIISNKSNKKVSIFDLDTFKGKTGWERATYVLEYTDTYDNQYPNAYIASHYATTKEDGYYVPIYLLDNKYSLCEGQIAWSKSSKNLDGSSWIEFYSDNELIYATDPITADSRVLTFSFSVEGVEKLTILRNGTRSDYIAYDTAYMVYPYLNLIAIDGETDQ